MLFLHGCGGPKDDASEGEAGADATGRTDIRSVLRNTLPETAARFVDKAPGSGVHFTYRNGQEAGHFSIVESLGGGVAVFDYDGDGRQDLFFPGGGTFGNDRTMCGLRPALYRNEGAWRFRDVTDEAGLNLAPYYSHGVAAGDFDGDGFPDLAVTGYGGLLLFHNRGDGTFEERAAAAGLRDKLWSSSAAWGDLDGDGHLDLYVAHYVDWSWKNHPFCQAGGGEGREVCPPRRFQPLPDVLYFSNGDGTFRDGTKAAGLASGGKGLGVLLADVDLDGRLDVYVTNDTVPNYLYQNLGRGKLKEAGLPSGTSRSDSGTPDGSMGTDVGDYNLDGLPDLWVANYERESFALYRNDGGFTFTHVSQTTGVTALGGLYVGWGTAFFDFDRDGDEDLFVANGHVIRYPTNAPLRQRPLLLENLAGKRFVNVASAAGSYMAADHMGRGAAAGDLDGDGDLDLVVVHTNEPAALLSNESKTANGWLSLRLIGTKSSRDPIGAVARLKTSAGTQVRQVKGGGSYASTGEMKLFFGLGRATIRQLEIRWPSGVKQTVPVPAANRVLTIIEPNKDE